MAKRTNVCDVCGTTYTTWSATSRYCSRPCVAIGQTKLAVACSVDGCDNDSRIVGMCKKHWTRMSRHGDPLVVLHRVGRGLSRYKSESDPGHPLAAADGHVYTHRKVLYADIGGGVHACHWCGKQVWWITNDRRVQLVVDHVDANKKNNALANLVPSCIGCNTLRNGHPKLRKTHCPQGHPYSGSNLKINANGARVCVTCRRDQR